ncbi:CpsD/CapB family tyrosine-protein kinase [uncultured Thiodictyon sp.]|jgi:Mrp family chromosome partitioning ATPase|uniref:CpsD/CapB family tyrosine-protein kinase n=1 Tax=uncultured Thiodictyon sp. TaxID=1846217 RepID=UPI0025EDAFD2|nr:CpsD/CapB family tyrosine-protein kinase [uncultured Thiodictyon sp.]
MTAEFIEFPEDYVELDRIYSRTIGAGLRSLAVTSADQEEGVTTLVVALAKRNRHSGRSTLVVDLNLHRPALHRRFGLSFPPAAPEGPHGPGDLPRVELADGLTVMPVPTNRALPILLRNADHFKAYLDAWLERYKVVIFDTTPLNGGNMGNIPAERIGHGCDGTILVVMAGVTPASAVRAALDRLKSAEVNLVGTVLNDCHNPSLAEELRRETQRFDRYFPGRTEKLRRRIRDSQLLNLET